MLGKKLFILSFLGILFSFSLVHNKPPKTKAELGELLFHEKLLSSDTSISCASCHIPAFAFSDTLAFSNGVNNNKTARNTPPITNMSARPFFFFDGRANSLEHQVHFPVNNSLEMNFSINKAVERLLKEGHYKEYFLNLYGSLPDSISVVDAIAQFERTLETSNTDFDHWMQNKPSNMTESAIRGREIFMGTKAKCFDCHFSPDFTGDEFRNIGLFDGKVLNDKGRFDHTKDSSDIGKFKVPGLRNVAVTAPYMHNGMFKTLREVIDYYDDPYKIVQRPINMDSLTQKPIHLTEQEKIDLEAFLNSLTDKRFIEKK